MVLEYAAVLTPEHGFFEERMEPKVILTSGIRPKSIVYSFLYALYILWLSEVAFARWAATQQSKWHVHQSC